MIKKLKIILHNYKIKRTESKLSKKLKQFSERFPENWRNNILKHCYLAGGCIYSLYNNVKPKDWDIFCEDKLLLEDMRLFLMKDEKRIISHIELDSMIDRIKRYGIYSIKDKIFTNYATTIGEFQIIHKFYGNAKEVVNQFDFMHNMFYFQNNKINCCSDFKYLTDKQLHFNYDRARDISGVLLRIPKFLNRGMTITKKEHALILDKLDKTDEGELAIIEKYVKGLGY